MGKDLLGYLLVPIVMKHILKEAQISSLVSDSGEPGWSGEVHLAKHTEGNYVVRKCKTLQRAKEYERVFNQLSKRTILPRFFGRYGKNLLYEYLPGRDLTKKESPAIIKQVGALAARINSVKAKGSIRKKFLIQLRHLRTGYFPSLALQVQPPITEEMYRKIRKLFYYLLSQINPSIRLDMSDSNPENFRLSQGKVYFIDVEAISPRINGFGIGKAFIKWFKDIKAQKAFLKGYATVSSTRYLTKHYLDFIYLNFYIQELDIATRFGKKYNPRQRIGFDGLYALFDKYAQNIL